MISGVLYIVEECGMPCFSLAVTEGQISIRNGFIYLFLCFGRGTSVARRDQGGRFGFARVMPGFLSEPI